MVSRPIALAFAVLVVLVAVVVVVVAGLPKSPEQRDQAARELLDGVTVSASVESVTLLATGAFADFGVGNGIKLVRVRIVDKMELTVEVASERDITFAENPKICLVGPDSAPDDAGLEDRCWGDAELGDLVFVRVVGPQQPNLGPDGRGVIATVTLNRGDVRCDYSPGNWVLQMKLNPLIDGVAAGARYIVDTPFKVPIPQHGPLPLLLTDKTRYCGMATLIYRDQGEPAVIE